MYGCSYLHPHLKGCLWKCSGSQYYLLFDGLASDSDSKESACNAGDPGLIPGSGISLGEANGSQYYLLFDTVFGMVYRH